MTTLCAVVVMGLAGGDAAAVYRRVSPAVVTVRTEGGVGTGFAIEGGRIVVTAFHVVKGFLGTIEVDGDDGVRYMGGDEAKDVAVLELTHKAKGSLTFNRETPEPGSRVYVVGNPLGYLTSTISEGIVSGLRQVGDKAYLQITAAVSHGSSGGPVVDDRGYVVGLVKGMIEEGQALNFAVSSGDILRVLDRVEEHDLAYLMRKADEIIAEPFVVGQLAGTLRPVKVYRSPSARSKVIATAGRDAMLIVRANVGPWTRVVMKDNSIGYVPSAHIKRYHLEMVSDQGKRRVRDVRPKP